jgi:hypothetical protein
VQAGVVSVVQHMLPALGYSIADDVQVRCSFPHWAQQQQMVWGSCA